MSAKRNEVFNEGSIQRRVNRILVTGGAGFIGSHLCDKLLENERNYVICVDNLYSGTTDNIAHLLNKHPRFEFIRHDVTQPLYVEVDFIYHLACPASPVFYQDKLVLSIIELSTHALQTVVSVPSRLV